MRAEGRPPGSHFGSKVCLSFSIWEKLGQSCPSVAAQQQRRISNEYFLTYFNKFNPKKKYIMVKVCFFLMMVVWAPVMGAMGVNNELIREAQEGAGDEGGNGSSTSNARGPYYTRLTALVAQVCPAQSGTHVWVQNPLPDATGGGPDTMLSSPTNPVQGPHVGSSSQSSTVSQAGNTSQTFFHHYRSLPRDFPTGDRTAQWGRFVEDHHAAWLWGLTYNGYTLYQWVQYFGRYSLWEWSTLCSRDEAQGQMWNDCEWYEYFQQHFESWSSLVWCLCFMHITPNVARRMISNQYFRENRRGHSDDSRGPEGGSSSSSCF